MAEIHIRLAAATDVVAIYELLLRSLDEIPHYPEAHEATAIAWILKAIEDGGAPVALIDGEIVGSLGLGPRSFPWSPGARFLGLNWYYVCPEHRRGRTAEALITMAQRYAALARLPLMLGITSGGDRVEAKDRFVRRCGMEYVGGSFYWSPPEGED